MSRSPGHRHWHRYDPLAVLACIARYQRQHAGRSPSQRRIRTELQISAPSIVHNLLHWLTQRGLLTITSYGHSTCADLTLTEAGNTAAQMWQQSKDAGSDAPDRS